MKKAPMYLNFGSSFIMGLSGSIIFDTFDIPSVAIFAMISSFCFLVAGIACWLDGRSYRW